MNPVESAVRRVDAFQQSHLPLAVAFAVVKKYGDDRAGALAALVAYYGFLAAFPLLLMLTTILGFVTGRSSRVQRAVLHSALRDFPIIGAQLGRSIHPLRGSGAALAAGLVGLLWGSLGVTQSAQMAMADVWNVPGVDRPPFFSRVTRGLGLFAVLGVGLAATTVAASVSTFGAAPGVARAAGLLFSLALNVSLYLLAFRILTVKSVATRCLVPGAVLGGAAWSVLQAVGGYLVGHQLRHASQVYGYFASVLGLVTWLYLGAQVTLY
ncbi:MAG: YihY/virulence factor BrkB family protein, partial [Actinobacteria bacterium]|nr:YihY/virulence factor BrkB family protein [Actinomycetota bacterium]